MLSRTDFISEPTDNSSALSPLVITAEHLEGAGQALSFAIEAETSCTRNLKAILSQPALDYRALSDARFELAACIEMVRRCVALVREVQRELQFLLSVGAAGICGRVRARAC